jgi:hypothetical protein
MMESLPLEKKSTFAETLVPHGWARVNQDEAGNRTVCEAMARRALLEGRNVVIDRCNFNPAQRAHWVGKWRRDLRFHRLAAPFFSIGYLSDSNKPSIATSCMSKLNWSRDG